MKKQSQIRLYAGAYKVGQDFKRQSEDLPFGQMMAGLAFALALAIGIVSIIAFIAVAETYHEEQAEQLPIAKKGAAYFQPNWTKLEKLKD